jgi:hypothetical protein
MTTAVLVLATVALAMLANLMVQVAVHRWGAPGNLVRSLISGFLAGTAVWILSSVYVITRLGPSREFVWQDVLATALMHLAGSFTFLCFVASGETSVRFQILRELRGTKYGLTLAELDSVYSNRLVIRTRLERLKKSGAITLMQDRYYLSSTAILIIAWGFLACRVILFGVETKLANRQG